MKFGLLHPADQIIMMMARIYAFGMTTTSGGNLSIMDSDGDIWITPSSIDKGTLEREDIVQVKPDGTIIGIHTPSVELPFHKMIYEKRPDLKAVLHAHPPALVAYSTLKKMPATDMIASVKYLCGDIQMAGYALPGSKKLGDLIAEKFIAGANTVMMDSHGVVIGSEDMFKAFMSFETLDYCARIEIKSAPLGKLRVLTDAQLAKYYTRYFPELDEYYEGDYSSEERYYRRDMCMYIKRAYNQQLFTSTQGTFARRLSDGSFIITPYNKDRMYLEPDDLVNIRNGKKEQGKTPSRAVKMIQAIFDTHPDINAVAIAHPPNIMAFAVTGAEFDARLIPESYIMLKRVQRMPYGSNLSKNCEVVEKITMKNPVMIVENDCIVIAGSGLLNVFDKLEVLEYSAKSVIAAKQLGEINTISEEEIKEIEVAFKL
ncbi:MAG: class II aldolase/adducin family protein [Christensenellaceae bacterium]